MDMKTEEENEEQEKIIKKGKEGNTGRWRRIMRR